MSDEKPEPILLIEYTEITEAQITEAYQWLWKFGFDVAERWLRGVTLAIEEEAKRIASPVVFRRAVVTEGSPYPGRVLYMFLYRQSRRGTTWKIYYELIDSDNDGTVDTLRVMKIHHASAQ